MPRVKSGVAHHARKKKIMQAAKGARGGRSKLYKAAKETVERGMRYAYRDRRKKKSEFRALWITRINAAARIHGLSYSRLMAGLRKGGVEINRKMLADLAVRDAEAFAKLAEVAKTIRPVSSRRRWAVARPHGTVSPRWAPFALERAAPLHAFADSRSLAPLGMRTRPAIQMLDAAPMPRLEADRRALDPGQALEAEQIAVLGRKSGSSPRR